MSPKKTIKKSDIEIMMKKGEIGTRRIKTGFPTGIKPAEIYKKSFLFYINLDKTSKVVIAEYNNKDNTLNYFIDIPEEHEKKINKILQEYLQNKKENKYINDKKEYKNIDEFFETKDIFSV